MVSNELRRLQAGHCYYSKWSENSYIIPLLYVNDILVVESSMKEIVNLKIKLVKEFSIKDLGPAKKILGIRISKERKEVVEDVTSRVREDVLKRFNMLGAKLMNVPLGGHFKLSKHKLRQRKMRRLSCRRYHMHQL